MRQPALGDREGAMTTDRASADQHGARRCSRQTRIRHTARPEATPQACHVRRQRPPSGAPDRQRETLRLYAADWRAFEDWCREQSLVPLPAEATTVAAFLTQGAKTLSAGTLTRRAAAIAAKHRQSGFASPAADPAVTAILRSGSPRRTPRRPAHAAKHRPR